MSKVEDILNNKRLEIEELEIPKELEKRLRGALSRVEPKKNRRNKWALKIAALFMTITLIGYNIDTLAFYGKKIMGYDRIMTDTLKELNELGKGQVIDKSYTFKNGVKVTVDGVMMDDNQLLMFYTIGDPRGNIDKLNIDTDPYIKGLASRYSAGGGQGERNEAGTEIKWKTEFEKPHFYEKNLKWSFALNGDTGRETGEITFKLDRSKAMGSILKKNINESMKIDQGEISFEAILASPTTTYLNGKVQNVFQLAKEEIIGEGFRPTGMDIRLIVNGREVSPQGGSTSSGIKGITFDRKFDALPKDLKTLKIKLVSFQSDNKVEEKIKLIKKESDKKVQILGKDIEINKVYESQGKTYVTITTEEEVRLSKVNMIVDGKSVTLKETNSDIYNKDINGVISHRRTLCFEGTGTELTLEIKGIMYNKIYNEIMDVSIN